MRRATLLPRRQPRRRRAWTREFRAGSDLGVRHERVEIRVLCVVEGADLHSTPSSTRDVDDAEREVCLRRIVDDAETARHQPER
jgi:hypothetical protein